MGLGERTGWWSGRLSRLVLLPLIFCPLLWAQVWIRTFDGPAHGRDILYCLDIDPLGNAIVTGSTKIVLGDDTVLAGLTLKYDPAGNRQWVRIQDNNTWLALVCDGQGNAYVSGSNGIGKYYANGELAWFWGNRVNGSAIALDRRGDVCVTGFITEPPPVWNRAVIAKYDTAGRLLWMWIDSLGSQMYGLALDTLDNIYVVGSDAKRGPPPRWRIMKFSPEGRLVWDRVTNTPGGAMSIAVTSGGEAYATGEYRTGTEPERIVTVKYSPDGEERWLRYYDGPGWDWGYPVKLGPDGCCYVIGPSGTQPGPWPLFDFVTIKYSPDGEELWVKRYDGSGKDDMPFGLAFDSSGNIYVGGWSQVPADSVNYKADYTLLKYDPDGNLLWEARYSGPDNLGGCIYSIAIDRDNFVYTAGNIFVGARPLYSYDACIIKYLTTGPGMVEPGTGRAGRSALVLSPNPARFWFMITGASRVGNVRLYDIAGNRLRVYERAESGCFPLAGLKSGVYLVKGDTPEGEFTRKLVVRQIWDNQIK
ncbi:MAG: SBBP repeat-containing protein [candidate division WOR-3 bacterium]